MEGKRWSYEWQSALGLPVLNDRRGVMGHIARRFQWLDFLFLAAESLQLNAVVGTLDATSELRLSTWQINLAIIYGNTLY